MIGVVQEQHSERTRLYQQWKNYRFPIVQDAINQLGYAVVPVPVLLDEAGYTIKVMRRPSELIDLLDKKVVRDQEAPKLVESETAPDWIATHSDADSVDHKIALADSLFRKGDAQNVAEAIRNYREVLSHADEVYTNGMVNFRMGVAYRWLYDNQRLGAQNRNYFEMAAKHWTAALDKVPSQYIWRRRIEQYGPRQMKPYPFYDWVPTAQKEIKERGDTPVELTVALTGSEMAGRMSNRGGDQFATDLKLIEPDPNSKIEIDSEKLVAVSTTALPQSVAVGGSTRIHVHFVPDHGKWNNESTPMKVWINPPGKGEVSRSLFEIPNGAGESSSELRTADFEFRPSKDSAVGEVVITGYALVNVCQEDGQCLYRRIEFKAPIDVIKSK